MTSVINCAGFGTFHAEDVGRLHDEISVDLTNVVDISRAFIEPLRAAGTGVLINVASMAAYQPNPNMAVYGGTKAFVLNFTEALWQESQGTGLRVLALSPGATKTEFFDDVGNNASGGVRMQTPKQVVDAALSALDRRTPPPSVAVGHANRFFLILSRLISGKRIITIIGNLTNATT